MSHALLIFLCWVFAGGFTVCGIGWIRSALEYQQLNEHLGKYMDKLSKANCDNAELKRKIVKLKSDMAMKRHFEESANFEPTI